MNEGKVTKPVLKASFYTWGEGRLFRFDPSSSRGKVLETPQVLNEIVPESGEMDRIHVDRVIELVLAKFPGLREGGC